MSISMGPLYDMGYGHGSQAERDRIVEYLRRKNLDEVADHVAASEHWCKGYAFPSPSERPDGEKL
jgi:hypothetical protein